MTYLFHNIGTEKHSNYNRLEDILALPKDALLTFDGIYYNVYENREALRGRKVILFVMGGFLGKDNTFDLANVPKLERYCSWPEILEMHLNYGFELGYHSFSHLALDLAPVEDLDREIKPIDPRMKYFAYPAGRYNQNVLEVVKKYYEDAWTVGPCKGQQFEKGRQYLHGNSISNVSSRSRRAHRQIHKKKRTQVSP